MISFFIRAIEYLSLSAFVYGFLKILRYKDDDLRIKNIKSSAILSILVYVFILSISSVWLYVFSHYSYFSRFITTEFTQLMLMILLAVISIIPIMMALYLKKESFKTCGICLSNLHILVILGCLVSLLEFIILIVSKSINTDNLIIHMISNKGFWILSQSIIVGFLEEFMNRGYLQTRMMQWIGKYKGYVVSTLIFAITHVPNRMFIYNMNFSQALANSLYLIPASLFFGYIFMKSKSIVPGVINHAFIDWILSL